MKYTKTHAADGNIAFKVTFVDREWRGVCSDETASYNINVAKKTWCEKQIGDVDNCRLPKYQDTSLLQSEFPCYDCRVLNSFEYFSGMAHGPVRDGEPLPSNKASVGKLAIFTSVKPEQPEENRFVFAVAPILTIEKHPVHEYDVFKCDSEQALIFREELRPLFWRSYFNANKPESKKWNTGLFRYVPDAIDVDLLEQVVKRGKLPAKTMARAEHLLSLVNFG